MADAKEDANRIRLVAKHGNLNCGDVEMAEMCTCQPPKGCRIECPVLTREKNRIKCWKIAIQGIHGHNYVASLIFPPEFPHFSPTLVYRSLRGGSEDLVATIIRNRRMMVGFSQSEAESDPIITSLDEEVDVDVVSPAPDAPRHNTD
jgi:hypothetical protein